MKDLTGEMVKKLVAGVSHEKIVQQLVERGWPAVSARQFVANLAQTVHQRDDVGEDREVKLAEYRERFIRSFITGLTTFGLMLAMIMFVESLQMIAFFFLGLSVFSFVDMAIAYIGYMKIRK